MAGGSLGEDLTRGIGQPYVSKVTEASASRFFNQGEGLGARPRKESQEEPAMLVGLFVTVVIATALGAAQSDGERMISKRPYNNRYNDASGAREDSLG